MFRKYPVKRSKSEIKLFVYLKKKYPEFKIISNDVKVCRGFELDIAFPELKLAIEWNGAYHREPIYGFARLQTITRNDKIKRKILAKKGWSIITIEDIDSKNPTRYSRIALSFIMRVIRKEEYKKYNSLSITLKNGTLKK